MDGNCSQGGFDFQDLHSNAMNLNQNQQIQHNPISRQFSSQACVHHSLPITDYNNGERVTSEDDGGDNKSKKNSHWQRVKWMDKMVKMMITALSYLGEDSGFRRKSAVLQKKGKWKLVSKAMDQRGGFHVSPQQCEDKFNNLNKRYKKLNEMLGRGTSCEVVENPALLDKIDYLNEKEKDEVRKIMSSKQLFYEEMCSYHNGNRLHLPHDHALQRSLHLMLRSCDHLDTEDLDGEEDVEDDDNEEHHLSHHGALGGPLKRLRRQSQSHEDVVGHPNHNEGYVPRLPLSRADVNRGMTVDSGKSPSLQKQWIESKTHELEERKLQIEAELMELERQRFKWERFSKKKDQKLEKMRMENEKMKLENERMTLELKRVELGAKL